MNTPIERAFVSLNGLSLGDAFGDQFFGKLEVVSRWLADREIPSGLWNWTDDTAMAVSIFRTLRRCEGIDEDTLADYFAAEYAREPGRKYGGMAHSILRGIGSGIPWAVASKEAFSGIGSYGNGGAMRAAPVGAFFADDLALAAEHGRRSAAVTHAHPEGIAGGIAVSVAAGWAAASFGADIPDAEGMFSHVLALTPESETRTGIQRAANLRFDCDPQFVATKLGSGLRLSAPDTVPFALWCAAKHFRNYREALWTTALGLGDVDTTCAIVGGIVALSSGEIPPEFLAHREPLPMDINEI